MSIPADNLVTDLGHIRHLEPAPGIVALYAIPAPPFYTMLTVKMWALVKQGGDEFVEALVGGFGSPRLARISALPIEGAFIDYLDVPLLTSPAFTFQTQTGQQTMLETMREMAIAAGQNLALRLQQQHATEG